MQSFKPTLIHDFLEPNHLTTFVEVVDKLFQKNKDFIDFDQKFQRYYLTNLSLFHDLHISLNAWLEQKLKVKSKPSYTFMVEYLPGGFCPRHYDRDPCKYTIALCLKQSHICPFWIEGETYEMKENSLLLYSGTEHLHERPAIENGFSRLILFHYVDSDFLGPLY